MRGHFDSAVLSDYWQGILAEPEADNVEEHLFACDVCGDRLRGMIQLTEGVRRLVREGSLRVVVSEAFVERAAAQGLRVRQYTPPQGGTVHCTVDREDDLLIARLAADLRSAKRIDLSILDEQGVEQLRLADIPADARTGAVVYQESMTFAKALPTTTIVARLVSVDEANDEQRLLGEYTLEHTAMK